MRVARWAFAVALVVGMTVLVGAQQPGRQPGGGKGGQPGGFGGGVGGFGGFGGGFGGGLTGQLLFNKDLQAELKVGEEQQEKLKALTEKQAAERQKLFEKLAESNRKEFDAALTEDQRKRLKQIEIQSQGLRAFTREENVKALNLTESQQTKIKAIADDTQKATQEAFREAFGGGGRPDADKMAEVQKKMQKLQKQGMADATDVLTADQQKVWAQMVGEPFDTSKLNRGFGGIGGGAFGGGAFGGNPRPAPKKE